MKPAQFRLSFRIISDEITTECKARDVGPLFLSHQRMVEGRILTARRRRSEDNPTWFWVVGS